MSAGIRRGAFPADQCVRKANSMGHPKGMILASDVRLIMAAEAELIANDGQVEMLAVARRAGLSVGAAYHHFGSKTGLIAAVVENFYAPMHAIMLGDAIDHSLPWMERETKRLKAYVDYHYDHPFAPLLVGRLGRDPAVIDTETRYRTALLKEGARNLKAGQAQGLVSAALDPEIAVGLVWGGVHQALASALLARRRPARGTLLVQIGLFVSGALGFETPNSAKGARHG